MSVSNFRCKNDCPCSAKQYLIVHIVLRMHVETCTLMVHLQNSAVVWFLLSLVEAATVIGYKQKKDYSF